MGNILMAKCHIRGTRLHIQHRFTPDAIPLEKQERTGVAGNDPEEWTRTCQLTASREMYVLPIQIFGMFCSKKEGAAKYVKKGKGSIIKDISSTLQIIEDQSILTREGNSIVFPEKPEQILEGTMPMNSMPKSFVLISSVVNPSTGARNVRYRVATKPGWELKFTALFDKTIVSRQQFEAVLRYASTLVGLSNSRSIGHGRFDVVSVNFLED